MILREINETLDELYKLYNEYDISANSLLEIEFEEQSFILDKIECVELLGMLLNKKNIPFLSARKIISNMKENYNNHHEPTLLKTLEENINLLNLNKYYDINKLKSNNFIEIINTRNRKIKHEVTRFNSFKDNQNNFDNMISILKIINLLNFNKIKYNIDFDFNTTNDNSEYNINKILLTGLKEYSNVRFTL